MLWTAGRNFARSVDKGLQAAKLMKAVSFIAVGALSSPILETII
jgi:hypothetical protein